MTRRSIGASLCLACLLLLSACNEQSAKQDVPAPVAMTEEAVGHYCNMNILEHTGPKAQVHLERLLFPIFFSQVRDAIAFMRLPEETQEAVVIYVNDMGKSEQWDFPGDNTWIDIQKAYFVINSTRTGGMGAPEAIPFGTEAAAKSFSGKHGGEVVRLTEIPDAYVLGPVELKQQSQLTTGSIK
jgi:copper chaperone NosL